MPERDLICLSAGANGSTGDIRPIVALALGLRARGFDIVVLGDAAFEPVAARAGLQSSEWFASSEVPQTFWLRTAAGQRGLWGERRRFRDRWLREELARHWADRSALFWRRVDGPDNPRLAAAVGALSAVGWLFEFGPRCAKVVSCPMPYQPSTQFTLDPPDLPPKVQRALARRRARPDEGDRRFCEELFHLVNASPAIFPRPTDWLPNMQVTGYTPLEHEQDPRDGRDVPEALAAFLRDGPAPVYVGFSHHAVLAGPRGARLAREIIDGCRRRGVRCVLQSPDLSQALGAADIFVLDQPVSHAWLFPRCAALVHHGGYGTVHASLLAGRPQVIYPFQTDQFLWAARLGELGAGPGFTARLGGITAARLAADLATVSTPDHVTRAARLGAALRADRGTPVQVAAIESIIAHTRRGGRPVEWRMPAIGD